MTTLGNTFIGLAIAGFALAILWIVRDQQLREDIASAWWCIVGTIGDWIGRKIGMDEPDEHERGDQ